MSTVTYLITDPVVELVRMINSEQKSLTESARAAQTKKMIRFHEGRLDALNQALVTVDASERAFTLGVAVELRSSSDIVREVNEREGVGLVERLNPERS